MREIKFRAWDIREKKMFNVESFDCARNPPLWFKPLEGYIINIIDEPMSGVEKTYKDNPFILMQYIGLKDRNGKEIYEWDIVKNLSNCSLEHPERFTKGIVKFGEFLVYDGLKTGGSEKRFDYYMEDNPPKSGMGMGYNTPIYEGEFFEIIGNIYENLDLL